MTHAHTTAAGRAFTLAELLVIVAGIGTTSAMLAPAVSGVKGQGQKGACLNNLRGTLQTTAQYAEDRHGQAPIAGQYWDISPTSFYRDHPRFPKEFKDNLTFWTNDAFGGRQIPMPFMLALADDRGIEWDQNSRNGMLAASGARATDEIDQSAFADLYRCPGDKDFRYGDEDLASSSLIAGGDTAQWWSAPNLVPEMNSYGFNEYVLGQSGSSDGPDPAGRLEGRIDMVPFPDETFLLIDSEPRYAWGDQLMTIWSDPSDKHHTLAEYVRDMQTIWRQTSDNPNPQFGFSRHGSTLNVAHVDGHVETVANSQEGWEQVTIFRSVD